MSVGKYRRQFSEYFAMDIQFEYPRFREGVMSGRIVLDPWPIFGKHVLLPGKIPIQYAVTQGCHGGDGRINEQHVVPVGYGICLEIDEKGLPRRGCDRVRVQVIVSEQLGHPIRVTINGFFRDEYMVKRIIRWHGNFRTRYADGCIIASYDS